MFLLLALVACTGGGSDVDSDSGADTDTETGAPPSGPATLLLRFDLDADLIDQMDEPAAGAFLGSIYAEADASPVGYNEGSTPLLDLTSDPLDYGTAGGLSEVAATATPLDPQVIWILGCFDSDANDCDCHDPITVPNLNKFEIVPGDNAITITLSLLNPQC